MVVTFSWEYLFILDSCHWVGPIPVQFSQIKGINLKISQRFSDIHTGIIPV